MISNKQKQANFRERKNKLGLFRKEYWLTLKEHKLVKAFIEGLKNGRKFKTR